MLRQAARTRLAYADNLKVALVAGVVVAHVTMAYAALDGTWVLSEPPVREPLLSLLDLAALVGVFFGMPLFFLVAGLFTPAALRRKGPRAFVVDRTVRLLVPSVVFVLVMSPVVEYVDTDNAGWSQGFWAFVPHVWTDWPPPPGPTWFLGVLLVFSLAYAAIRTLWPRRAAGPVPLRAKHLVIAVVTVAAATYLLRIAVPLGEERWHLAVAQAPAWVAGFTLGILGGELGWFQPLAPDLARHVRRVAWVAVAVCCGVVAVTAESPTGLEALSGGGTWQSLVLAGLEAVIMVTMSLWVLDLFQRRFDHQGRLARGMSRAAYGAFFLHQLVLVGLVVASRLTPAIPELRYVAVSVLGVALSFGLAALVVRLPGVSRVL